MATPLYYPKERCPYKHPNFFLRGHKFSPVISLSLSHTHIYIEKLTNTLGHWFRNIFRNFLCEKKKTTIFLQNFIFLMKVV